jgi:hypothetical protein
LRDVRAIGLEQLGFDPGRVIFVERGDPLEQLTARLVVKEAARNAARAAGKAGQDRVGEVGVLVIALGPARRSGVPLPDQRGMEVAFHHASEASRRPVNCQR